MPVFVCPCGTVENTALGEYWVPRSMDKDPQCSACATGIWHGRFPREEWDGKREVIWRPETLSALDWIRITPAEAFDLLTLASQVDDRTPSEQATLDRLARALEKRA